MVGTGLTRHRIGHSLYGIAPQTYPVRLDNSCRDFIDGQTLSELHNLDFLQRDTVSRILETSRPVMTDRDYPRLLPTAVSSRTPIT